MSTDIIDLCSDTEESPVPPRQQQRSEGVVELLSDQEETETLSAASSTNDENAAPSTDTDIDTDTNQSISSNNSLSTKRGTLLSYFSVRSSSGNLFKGSSKRAPNAASPVPQPPAKKSRINVKKEGALQTPTKPFEPDPDVAIIEPTPAAVVIQKSSAAGNNADHNRNNDNNDDDDDNDCMIVGQKGDNALSDFPHSREDCVIHPFSIILNAEKYCPNCYCFVCDIPASHCPFWTTDQHCRAKFRDYFWKCERNRKRREGKQRYVPRQNPTALRRRRHNNLTDPVVRPRVAPPRSMTTTSLSFFAPSTTTTSSSSSSSIPPARVAEVVSTPALTRQQQAATTSSATITTKTPMVPLISPWINTTVKLIGVDMSVCERILYDHHRDLYKESSGVAERRRRLLEEGAAPATLELTVVGPLSMYRITTDLSEETLQRTSSKIRRLTKDLVEARSTEPRLVAVVFCQDPKWRNAIVAALLQDKFVVIGDHTVATPTLPGATGLVHVLSTFPKSSTTAGDAMTMIPSCARVYFMEQYINMAWESITLGRIARPSGAAGPTLQVRKMVFKKTAEENVVNFQNALIAGTAKMQNNCTEVDKAGVAILMLGLN